MKARERKYDEVMDFLRRSKPVMRDQKSFTEKVINEINAEKPSEPVYDLIYNYLFGWVYIGWVRRSLVTVSFMIILVFIYQQSVIIKRINAIDRQAVFTSSQLVPGKNGKPDTKQLFLRAKYTLPVSNGTLTGKQVDELIESFNELQVRYMDILQIIKEDPELKSYIEKKLNQKDLKKLNL